MITEKEYEQYMNTIPSRGETKIGSKKEAIRQLKTLGWDDMEEMKQAFREDHGCPLYRVGRTYYWT